MLKASCSCIFCLFPVIPNNVFVSFFAAYQVCATSSVPGPLMQRALLINTCLYIDHNDVSKQLPFQMKVLILHWEVPQKITLKYKLCP